MLNRNEVTIKRVEFDATHSWNGYCYQGKIALIVVIDYIINCIKGIEDISQYKIEFEYLEDFSIIKNTNYLQIHQVKSYGPESLSSYKDAVWLLLGKSVYEDYETVEKSYLHTADIINSASGIIDNPKSLKRVLTSYSKPSSSKSTTQKSPLELFEYIEERGLLDKAFKKFSLYRYADGKVFCSLLEVEYKVKEKIIEYYKFIGKEQDLREKGILTKYVECAYVNLVGTIDKHVNERHFNRQKDVEYFNKEINFSEIVKVLNEEYEKLPVEYYVFYLKDKVMGNFNRYYSQQKQIIQETYEFQADNQESIIECKKLESGLNKVLDLIKYTYTEFKDEEFLLFCHKINPHVRVDFTGDFISISELVNSNFLHYPWFQSLVDFHENIKSEDFLININNHHYLASTIVHPYPDLTSVQSTFYRQQMNATIEATISNIAVNILENKEIYKELYKIDNIITGNINKPLKDYVHKTTTFKEYNNENAHHHIMDIKNINLIDINECRIRGEKKHDKC
ncbi:ABC-three component system protein [Cytobacillus horneckiae]|uniref:ABC-three component system protein n=1 Tax=Cytobacillus horneckiae TaxID=549687 RepID=UPI0039A30250